MFLAQNTLHAGDFGYGLLYGAIGAGLVVGSLVSNAVVERIGIARAYGGSLALMAVGFGVGAASANIWMAAVCCVVGGVGDGGAVVCNALLVQRGTQDAMRGRALTFVMSATWTSTGVGIVLAGALMGVERRALGVARVGDHAGGRLDRRLHARTRARRASGAARGIRQTSGGRPPRLDT